MLQRVLREHTDKAEISENAEPFLQEWKVEALVKDKSIQTESKPKLVWKVTEKDYVNPTNYYEKHIQYFFICIVF